MNVNVKIALNCIRAALKPMIAAKRGRIVAVGSRAAVEPLPNFAAYAVSKAALVALVKNVGGRSEGFGDHGERRSAQHDRHGGESRGDAESGFREMGEAGIDREIAGVAGLGRCGGCERRGDSDLREGLRMTTLS